MKKKLLALITACALCVTFGVALTACNDPTPTPTPTPTPATPEETLKEGYFAYSYTAEGYGTMDRFMRFYDDIVYYGQAGGGGSQGYVYNYSIAKTDYAYSVWYTREERSPGEGIDPAEKHTGTAEYTITVTDMKDSTKTYSLGYDGTYIYSGDAAQSGFIIADAQTMRFTHDAKNEGNFTEVNQAIVRMEKADDETSFIEINHNGTYSDAVNMMIEGTYTKAKGADGKVTYTLTPNTATDTAATFVVAADGQTGVYTPAGGEAVNLQVHKEKVALLTLTGNGSIVSGENTMDVVYNLKLYDDYTCVLESVVASQTIVADRGTFALASDYSYDFTFDTLGVIHSTIDASDRNNIIYTVVIPANEQTGATAVTLSNGTVKPSPEEAKVIYTLTGTHSAGSFPATLVLKDDDTATYTVEMPAGYGGTNTSTGTWTNEKATFGEGATLIEIALTIDNGIATGANSTQKIALTNVVYTLTGTHSAGNFPATLVLASNGSATYTVEMPAGYGGTNTSAGTWTNEKATFGEGATLIEIALTIDNGIATGANSTQKIALTNVVYTLTGTHSAGNFPATLVLANNGSATYTVEMPAAYGGTNTSAGTWTNEKATFGEGATLIEIALTIDGETVTGTNTAQKISLSNAVQDAE